MITKQGYEMKLLWVQQIWNCWAEFGTNLTPIETMIGCREDVDEDGDGSSSVLDGWLVANYLMMSIANGGAGQKKIGKIRQQRSFTLGEIFFLFFAQAKATEACSKCLSGRNSGPLSRAFTILTFRKD